MGFPMLSWGHGLLLLFGTGEAGSGGSGDLGGQTHVHACECQQCSASLHGALASALRAYLLATFAVWWLGLHVELSFGVECERV